MTTALDSLRAEVARLTATLAGRQSSIDLLGAAAGASDTAAVMDPGERVRETARDARFFGLRLLWASILMALTLLIVRGSVWILEALAERSASRRLLFKKMIPIVRLAIWTVLIYYILTTVFNIDRAGLLAGTAALGVGVGFAAQGVLKNFFGGLIIIFDQPFQVGDKIRVGETYGEVVSIGMRATRIVTPDDNLVSVPNAQIIDDQVANANAGALDCQVEIHLYLPAWIDVVEAKTIAYKAATSSKYVFLKKPVRVIVKDEYDEGMFLTHFVVRAYVLDARYEFAFSSDVTEAAKAEFARRGFITPTVSRYRHDSVPASAGQSA